MRIIFCFLAAIFLANYTFSQSAADTAVQQILFLGNSITYAGTYITDMETFFALKHPRQKFNFINLGLPSETVSGLSEPGHADGKFPRPDLHERLHRILLLIHPQIIFACYGMNDGIYLPFDSVRFKKFTDGMIWLKDTLQQTGARVIIVTPPVYDELRGGATGYAKVLDNYSDWIIERGKKDSWEVADIHYPMKRYLDAHRQVDARYGISGFALADDGVHPGETGHWMIAKELLWQLGEKQVAEFSSMAALIQTCRNGKVIEQLIASRQVMMKDAWLTYTGHTRPGMTKGLDFLTAQTHAKSIQQNIDSLLCR